jgi:hypothetical protein
MSREINKKSPYWLLLLCLIPLIGAFVGIYLIYQGIYKFKDKVLIFMGCLGLIFTVGIYSYLFYDLKYGEGTGRAFARISKKELNILVKDINMYKAKFGEYPDSLEQLKKIDPLAMIEDPVLVRKMDKNINVKFVYSKEDNKYKLFSVGIDGVPNTTDDIYPTSTDLENDKP